jgi:hypothetical protein
VLLTWRFLRHPDRDSGTARAATGWTALLLSALGIIHIAKGTHRTRPTVRAPCKQRVAYSATWYRAR